MLTKKEIEFVLQQGEGLKIEFKESPGGIDKDMVAFANAEGGRIFLGVNDKAMIVGLGITNAQKSQVQDITNNCDPRVEISMSDAGNVLVIEVKEGKDKPYKCREGFFIRVGPNSQKMNRDSILDFAIAEGRIRFDSQTSKVFDFKGDFDREKLQNYLRTAGISKTLPDAEMLANLGVARLEGDKVLFNNAGVLFFAREPCRLIPQAYVTCIRYNGIESVNIIDRIDLREDIVSNIDNTMKFVSRSTRLGYEIKGLQRKEIPEYPVEAIREAVTNAVMHRDYFESGANVFVSIFDDRLEVYNPGGLPKGLAKEDFGRKCVRRNPLIADLLHRIGYVEKAGTGVARMKSAMKNRGLLEPKIEVTSFFTIIFRTGTVEKVPEEVTEKVGERVGERVGEKLTENQTKIISAMLENPLVASKELSSLVGISPRKIEENIAKLKKTGLLKRVGPDRGGHWKIIAKKEAKK